MERQELTDQQFATLAPLLPPQKPRTGRPANDHRTVLEGILWVLRTGAPWRDVPTRFGSWRTISSRFRRWQQAGVWDLPNVLITPHNSASLLHQDARTIDLFVENFRRWVAEEPLLTVVDPRRDH